MAENAKVLRSTLVMAMLYSKLPPVILAKIIHHICGRRAILERDVQPPEREELDQYRLKLPVLHRHIVDISELVKPTGSVGDSPHATDCTIANELW